MGDAMTIQSLKPFKTKLFGQRREIFNRLKRLDDGWQELSLHDIEKEEEAQKDELSELYNQLDLREKQEIDEIDKALDRMNVGKYGVCERCGKDISPERLKVLPATPHCVKCSGRLTAK